MPEDGEFTAAVNFSQLVGLLRGMGHTKVPIDPVILAAVAEDERLAKWTTENMNADPRGFRESLAFYMAEE